MDERKESERLWKAQDAADFLGWHVQTVYRKARDGEIPSEKIGASRRFVPAKIRALAVENESAA